MINPNRSHVRSTNPTEHSPLLINRENINKAAGVVAVGLAASAPLTFTAMMFNGIAESTTSHLADNQISIEDKKNIDAAIVYYSDSISIDKIPDGTHVITIGSSDEGAPTLYAQAVDYVTNTVSPENLDNALYVIGTSIEASGKITHPGDEYAMYEVDVNDDEDPEFTARLITTTEE